MTRDSWERTGKSLETFGACEDDYDDLSMCIHASFPSFKVT